MVENQSCGGGTNGQNTPSGQPQGGPLDCVASRVLKHGITDTVSWCPFQALCIGIQT